MTPGYTAYDVPAPARREGAPRRSAGLDGPSWRCRSRPTINRPSGVVEVKIRPDRLQVTTAGAAEAPCVVHAEQRCEWSLPRSCAICAFGYISGMSVSAVPPSGAMKRRPAVSGVTSPIRNFMAFSP